MFNHEILDTLTNIRIDLLRYWSSEKDSTLKGELSKHLDALDALIISKRKQMNDILYSTGGSNGKPR